MMTRMKRGLVLIVVAVALCAVTGMTWYFSDRGQLWWMNVKFTHVVLPKFQASPGGLTQKELIAELNPQFDRLLARRYVSWYSRRFVGEATWEQADLFDVRLQSDVVILSPYDLFAHALRGRTNQTKWVNVVVLVNEAEHPKIDAIVRDIFGSPGEDIPPIDP